MARRSDTTRPPDEAAGCCHCLHDVDSVGAVEWSKPGAATAYMTVKKKSLDERRNISECMHLPRRWAGAKLGNKQRG